MTWAHPEYGQVVATCSFDRTAAVWEEMVGETRTDGQNRSWIKRTSLVDSRTAVTDVKFAPKHMGLQLVCNFDIRVGHSLFFKEKHLCLQYLVEVDIPMSQLKINLKKVFFIFIFLFFANTSYKLYWMKSKWSDSAN